ncbi:NAD(P)H-binding protein [Nocardia sp. NPDC051463]|uniref:SDR family oxidoreductase n=1 Tax=Nocardia sp. NPDC051463 TaxID=3154845 RepID=UPI00344468ED
MTNSTACRPRILVTGGTGKTGSRIVTRLRQSWHPVRIGSRTATVPFDWDDRGTWAPALNGVYAVYIAYQPDLAVPGAPIAIHRFAAAAKVAGVRKLVLLSGRGEPQAQKCERMVQDSGLDWTVVRCSFFAQNFSEGAFTDYVLAGEVALPNGDVPEPFVHADDIADVAVAALTEDTHKGEVYELTGPRALTFAEAVAEIAAATEREIAFVPLSRTDFIAALTEYQVPSDAVSLLDYLFGTVLDGRNSATTDGVHRALGRQPKDFAEYVRDAAHSTAWNALGRKIIGRPATR